MYNIKIVTFNKVLFSVTLLTMNVILKRLTLLFHKLNSICM